MKSILFVCPGNICCSLLADGIAGKIARDYNLDPYPDSAETAEWVDRAVQNFLKKEKLWV